jgi:hypothetical protein
MVGSVGESLWKEKVVTKRQFKLTSNRSELEMNLLMGVVFVHGMVKDDAKSDSAD